jgi:hypothetical protein
VSYLAPPRIHFAGRFQAAVSTVNNDPTNFENATFGADSDVGWNPSGDGDWRLIGCGVTSALRSDGSAAADDPVLGCLVADSDRRAPAKLVDLDPQQQMVSTIWGLEIRICDVSGSTLLRGRFAPAAFADLWFRAKGPGDGDDQPLGACYQSVVADLQWDDAASGSATLADLRRSATDGLLSIKFNVDGYNLTATSEDFTLGRIVGTIGVATADEPRHLVRGRRFMATLRGLRPAGQLNSFTAVVDDTGATVHCDVGNALPTTVPGGPLADVGTLQLVAAAASSGAGGPFVLGEIPYREPGWYERTAGIVSLPADRGLTSAEIERLREAPLQLASTAAGPNRAAVAEPPNGLYARADEFVFRLDAGQTAPVRFVATRYGRPHAGASLAVRLDASQLQGGPPVATPAEALQFPDTLVTDEHGVAALPIAASDPGRPRESIDGQVFGVRAALVETLAPGSGYPHEQAGVVSLRIWGEFASDEPPTWWGSIQPLFGQYANLYPVMRGFLDLGSYDSVCAHRELLLFAFGLPSEDPNAMPVTRDLSSSARAAILRWLRDVGPDGKPLLGQAPAPSAAPRPQGVAGARASRDGKAAAAARRLGDAPVAAPEQ